MLEHPPPPRAGGLLALDGSYGEGGGQILRTALSLAVALRRPVRLTRIRAGRPKPGLRPQHLAVVRALTAVGEAEVVGAALGSTELTFTPLGLRGGDHRIDIGAVTESAGSVTLLFQALLLPLAFASTPSRLALIGGTHVPWSPPLHYLSEVFLPALDQIGVEAQLHLRRWGWYPAGGGEAEGIIQPSRGLTAFNPERPPALGQITGVSAVSRLPRAIAERQRRRAMERLATAGLDATITLEADTAARGPGTLLFLAVRGRAGFSALGRRGIPAERVADEAVDALLAFRESGGAVDDHLADQLVAFLALAPGTSEMTCQAVSSHLKTVAWAVQAFLAVRVHLEDGPPARVRITQHEGSRPC